MQVFIATVDEVIDHTDVFKRATSLDLPAVERHDKLVVAAPDMQVCRPGIEGIDADAQTIPVIAMYNITPNFRVWGEARFDVGTDDGDKSFKAATWDKQNFEENVYSLGARYTF